MKANRQATRWIVTTLPLAPLSVLVYVFFEWLFIVTKPSPTGSLPFPTQLLVLARSPLPLFLPLVAIQAAMSLLSVVRYPQLRGLAVVPAAIVTGVLILLLADNFTYTLFGFGMLTSGGLLRKVYAALGAMVIAGVGWKLSQWSEQVFHRRDARRGAVLLVVLFVCAPPLVTLATTPPAPDLSAPPSATVGRGTTSLPNILFLGIDGVDDPILSAYEYERETTPFLKSIGDETLFFENAFSNASHTHGSIVTLLTGRLPFSTHVTFPPTVLRGDDARRHLPAMLRNLGYTTLQIGMRHYADAEDANLLDAFDAANYRWQRLDDLRTAEKAADETDAFRTALAERLQDRASQLFGFGYVANGFAHVQGTKEEPTWKDDRRIETLVRYFVTAREPWFVHLHLLDTHCCNYHPDEMYFSDGDSLSRNARDSEVRETDANIRKLFETLRASGLIDRTVIVISSDHTSEWTTTGRVPLMMRFPRAEPHGRVTANVQVADVAPTVLDYLQIEIPRWMDGVSLLRPSGRAASRPIFAVADVTEREGRPTNRALLNGGPPNYGTASISLVDGSQWFLLSLLDGTLRSGPIVGHTQPDIVPTPESQARSVLLAQIASAGFRVGP